MEFKTFVFYLLSVILVFAALRVITTRNPVQAALFLVLAFFNASGIWLLLEAEFLALVLVLVYVGAVMVLFLFVVMMLDVDLERVREGFWRHLPAGLIVGGLLLVEILLILWGRFHSASLASPHSADYSNTKAIGEMLYTEYAYPLELASLVLLVAMVVAVALTLRKRKTKYISPSEQVAVKSKDRMRLVDMPVEKE